jgi:hypothetical protein
LMLPAKVTLDTPGESCACEMKGKQRKAKIFKIF